MSPVLLLLLLFPLSFEASSVPVGSRSILRAINGPDPPGAAVDLSNTDFDLVLRESPASFAIVEFFAHWCPACRNYKPQYEKVARLFNGPDAVHPGIMLMARVDCALKINTNLCNRFSVERYPTLLWGPPLKFSYGNWEPKQDKSEIHAIDDRRTADRLLNWINQKLGSSYNLDDGKFENEHLLENASHHEQVQPLLEKIVRAVYDVEEATFNAFKIILEHKIFCCGSKNETRSFRWKRLELETKVTMQES